MSFHQLRIWSYMLRNLTRELTQFLHSNSTRLASPNRYMSKHLSLSWCICCRSTAPLYVNALMPHIRHYVTVNSMIITSKLFVPVSGTRNRPDTLVRNVCFDQNTDQWWDIVNMTTNFFRYHRKKNFLSSWETISLSKKHLSIKS